MYYRNQGDYDQAEIVFYEIFRKHTSTDPRDCGASWDYIIGSADSVPEAEDLCQDLNNRSDEIQIRRGGYQNVWEDITLPDGRSARKSTNKWTDEFGYASAIEEIRKIDPTYYSGDRPEYRYRAVRRLPKVKIVA